MKIGKDYKINPFGCSEYNATLVGYISIKTSPSKSFPVYHLDFYAFRPKGKNCYMTLFKGKAVACGTTIEMMEADFYKNLRYVGRGREFVHIGDKKLTKDEFISQCKKTSMTDTQMLQAVESGRFHAISSSGGGEIKMCPSCNVLRDTSCCACGCGSCKICDYRWTCMPFTPTSFTPISNSLIK